jgi:hypothetical protein
MRYNQTVLVLYGEQVEAFTDLKKFCKIKGATYNTLKQKKFPIKINGFILNKELKGVSMEFIQRDEKLIKIQ